MISVPRMGGFCYEMDDDRLAEEDELPKVEKVDKMPKIVYLGKGRCRGEGWAEKVWPILIEGRRTIEGCARECAARKRCLVSLNYLNCFFLNIFFVKMCVMF